MSYADAVALQSAIHACLVDDPDLNDLVGGSIFDAVPEDGVPDVYVAIGAEETTRRGDSLGQVIRYRVEVSVIGRRESFVAVKSAASAAEVALTRVPLEVPGAEVVELRLERTRARRGKHPARRRIDLTFRITLDQAI